MRSSFKRRSLSVSLLRLFDLRIFDYALFIFGRSLDGPDAKPPVIYEYDDEEDAEHLSRAELGRLQSEVKRLEQTLTAAQPNLRCIQEWQERDANYQALSAEFARADAERAALRTKFDALTQQRHQEFMSGLRAISGHLRNLYALITAGGTAELELVDTLDPFAEGVAFSVMPPRKTWRPIANLSGGEKTLASLALVFALHAYKPCPLYVMDEIDAALDFRNVAIIAAYIRHKTLRSAQFMVISLRDGMFEAADRLVGVYKVKDRTRCVAMDPARFAPFLQTASSS